MSMKMAHARISILVGMIFICSAAVRADYKEAEAIGRSEATLRPAPKLLRINRSNPHYFTDGSGKAIYLTGSHNDPNMLDMGTIDPPPAFDFTAYLAWLQRHNHNFIRLWRWSEATKFRFPQEETMYVEPHPWLRTGPGRAGDGKLKFDLTQFNEEYFKRVRDRAEEAGENGFYVSIMLFDGAAAAAAEDFGIYHPFHIANNINQIDADQNGDGKIFEAYTLGHAQQIVTIQKQYVQHIVETVNDLDNVLYEICNECHEDSTDWQYSMIRFIKESEAALPKQHPVGMTGQYPVRSKRYDNTALMNSPADWISPMATPSEQYMQDPPVLHVDKVSLLDSDHIGVFVEVAWVWKSFTRGHHPIFIDHIEPRLPSILKGYPYLDGIRRNMGYALGYANKIDLARMKPNPELCSTTYCLSNPGNEYLVFVPSSKEWTRRALKFLGFASQEEVMVDLRDAAGHLSVEWLNTDTGETMSSRTTTTGGQHNFKSPFGSDSVLYLARTSDE